VIDEADTIIASLPDPSVRQLLSLRNEKMKFLPTNIGKAFPRLLGLHFWGTQLKVIESNHFKNLRELGLLTVANKIRKFG
jgi:hypothetical protein